jgi:NAD(P)-dependent dehydrogenase (short-subunit alcohol dehydrogenase family)
MSQPSASRGLAVVTGGSSGIGLAVAARLHADGHPVLLTGRNADALAKAAAELGGGSSVEVAAFDVADEAGVEEHLRPREVEILVNNAGWANSSRLDRLAVADWNAMLAVHATGSMLCSRAVIGGMVDRNYGRIITINSMAGVTGEKYIAAYVAAKHAAIGLMRATAAEVRGTGVTANAVCPAYVDTPMTDRSVDNIVKLTGKDPDDARSSLARMGALGRMVTPEEVAAAVAYFASPEAGAVNGQTLILDGGGIFG